MFHPSETILSLLYALFWVITRRLEFICRRFGTLCLFHLHRQVDVSRMNNYFCTLTLPYPVTHPPNGSRYFEPNLFSYRFSFLVHSTHIYLPMKMEQTECSETSSYKFQTPGYYPKKAYNVQNTA